MKLPPPCILIVEDEAHIRKFLRISLEAHGYRILESRLGSPGLDLCRKEQPGLVILDLGLPDMDGKEFIQDLRHWSQVPVIVLSVRSQEQEKVEALDAGANDYMTKPFGIRELIARMRVLLRSAPSDEAPETVFRSGSLIVDLPKREVSVDGKTVHLTKKEYDLLRLLIHFPGQVLTHQQILREVWDPSRESETQYLRVLVRQLRNKLGDDPSRPRFIVTVQGVGYRLAVPES